MKKLNYPMNSKQNPKFIRPQRGFALVVTVSLMVLLALMAVGMLSLSAVSLRSANQDSAQSEARANARMALMVALGELQKQMGPDQRISANAEILTVDESGAEQTVTNPNWTGVWDSWIAGPIDREIANPNYPSVESHHQTIGARPDDSMRPEYANKDRYFRKWLLSLSDKERTTKQETALNLTLDGKLMPGRDDVAVQLVGESTLGDSADPLNYISAGLISTGDNSTSNADGRYAWWVGDESQKARIMEDTYETDLTTLSTAQKIHRQSAPASTGVNRAPGFENFENQEELSSLPSLKSTDLLTGIPEGADVSRSNFYSITTDSLGLLTDVREGGFRRDLNTLLEQPIDIEATSMIDKHMLYEFDDPRFPAFSGDYTTSSVPIQDLSAYYQLYQDDPSFNEERRGGIEFDSTSIGVTAPDFGDSRFGNEFKEKYLREYTALYRNPIPIRVQLIVSIMADPITPQERSKKPGNNPNSPSDRDEPIRASQTHQLVTAVIPVVTLWNPNNVKMTLDSGFAVTQALRMSSPAFYIQWTKYRSATDENDPNSTVTLRPTNLMHWASGHNDPNDDNYIAGMAFSENNEITFEPGEVKMFSLPADGSGPIYENEVHYDNVQSATLGWDPNGFLPMLNSVAGVQKSKDAFSFWDPSVVNYNRYTKRGKRIHATFGKDDAFAFEVHPEDLSNNVSRLSEVGGSAFNFWMINKAYTPWSRAPGTRYWKNYMLTTRGAGNHDGGNRLRNNQAAIPFNQEIIETAFPPGQNFIPREPKSEAITGQEIIDATNRGFTIPLFQFTLTAASEVSGNDAGGFNNNARRIVTRPFLHGSTIAPPFIDQLDPSSLYTYGWEWQLEKINAIGEVPVQNLGESSYYGGGYTAEFGTTRVVQREIPTLPPMSIAALSHAHLGGFSLANESAVEFNNPSRNGIKRMLRDITRSQGYQRVTAFGQAGLAPHTLQAIGNSYAHPKIPADKAFTTWTRLFDYDSNGVNTPKTRFQDPVVTRPGGEYDVPVADHSYLANKALWDEYFFSSISPQPADIPFFSASRTAKEVAREFFFEDVSLPNRRFIPNIKNIDEEALDVLFDGNPLAVGGLYDSIAIHMMVNGSFNINSTSVNAWKIFLSSHRANAINYYENGSSPTEHQTASNKTPVGFGSLPNAEPITDSILADPANSEQWTGWREISDTQIDQLAEAIVYQVKRRGPFLSISEFINRRLDSANTDLAVKGALQAALDFEGETGSSIPEVTINKAFRSKLRSLDNEITASMKNDSNTKFPEAFDGPAAYGSAPYVDQADLLRGFAGLLTPRGDTFKIRAYGDALDAAGNVVARAWCEATVQRTPAYVDPLADENYLPQADLVSDSNRKFGRRFRISKFRWMNPDEI